MVQIHSPRPFFSCTVLRHPPMPRIQMLDGFNEGWIEFEGAQIGSRKGSVELETVLQTLIERAALTLRKAHLYLPRPSFHSDQIRRALM